jgi:energy-coupling factor transporter ATP-binding protein EcfA2
MTEAGLKLDDVTISLGPKRLLAISHNVAPGDVLTVMGPSGSGKSSLLAFIGGFLAPCLSRRPAPARRRWCRWRCSTQPWRGDGRIVLLEPRRLAARAAARRMASLLGEEPGGTVGYAMRMESRSLGGDAESSSSPRACWPA